MEKQFPREILKNECFIRAHSKNGYSEQLAAEQILYQINLNRKGAARFYNQTFKSNIHVREFLYNDINDQCTFCFVLSCLQANTSGQFIFQTLPDYTSQQATSNAVKLFMDEYEVTFQHRIGLKQLVLDVLELLKTKYVKWVEFFCYKS